MKSQTYNYWLANVCAISHIHNKFQVNFEVEMNISYRMESRSILFRKKKIELSTCDWNKHQKKMFSYCVWEMQSIGFFFESGTSVILYLETFYWQFKSCFIVENMQSNSFEVTTILLVNDDSILFLIERYSFWVSLITIWISSKTKPKIEHLRLLTLFFILHFSEHYLELINWFHNEQPDNRRGIFQFVVVLRKAPATIILLEFYIILFGIKSIETVVLFLHRWNLKTCLWRDEY